MATIVEGSRIPAEQKRNIEQAEQFFKNATGSGHDFTDDPLFLQAGVGSTAASATPWWVLIVIAAAVYGMVKR